MPFPENFHKRPVHRDRTQTNGVHGLGEAGQGRAAKWVRASFEAVENVLELGQGDDCPALCVCYMPLSCTLLKWLKW